MRFDDQYSAREYRRECSRDDSWMRRQDDAERDRHLARVSALNTAELDRQRRRLLRLRAVATKRAARGGY